MVSHEIIYGDITILTDVAELDLGDILQFWDPNQHLARNLTSPHRYQQQKFHLGFDFF